MKRSAYVINSEESIMTRTRQGLNIVITGATACIIAACGGGGSSNTGSLNIKPGFVGVITMTTYSGTTDDLATAGLGKTGLGAAAAPAPANPAAPTAVELRRIAYFNNYRAILDINPKGGYGSLYGPNIDINGNDTLGEGKIAGNEYLAYADDGTGVKNVTMMVQIPTSFNRDKPCIVTAVSSGSRGVYGAVGSAGEWGLKHGCVVAYSDKGSGMGVHDLATNTVNVQDGTRIDAGSAGKNSNFTAALSASELATFNAATPNRVAVKHAQSQQNPEKDWGQNTLDAVKFAFYVLNEERGDAFPSGGHFASFKPDNTIVIASSVSNGAGAALAAAELDTEGLIDGIAVSEPQIQLQPNAALTVKRGGTTITGTGRPLFDYVTFGNLYQPCATMAPSAANAPGLSLLISVPTATNRCASLKAKGLLTKSTLTEQAEEALGILRSGGFEPESTPLYAGQYFSATHYIATTYAMTYGRFSVKDALCGFSFAGVDASNKPAPIAAATLAQGFGTGNGVPVTAGIQIINDNNPAGPINTGASTSPSTGLVDYNIDGALCLRNLYTGSDANATRVKNGIGEVLKTANLHGKPAIIVHGRADSNVPVGFSSRPYFGQNKIVEGAASQLSYIEVTNAQHFDILIDNAATPGVDALYVPLHYYYIQAMDKVWARLTQNVALPPSQVLRTTPRGGTPGSAPAITIANVPPIISSPAAANLITFSNNTVTIPD
jgi:hydroxybutyrate-dimer hydrolase